MNIILTLTNYKNLTGSEIYVYELSRELAKRGHQVTILANDIGGELVKRTTDIDIFPFFNHPELFPDLVINSQPAPTVYGLTKFPKAKQMQIIHSVFSYEEPIYQESMIYVAVRPEIKKHWEEAEPRLKGYISVVWNGFDEARFNTEGIESPTSPVKLFVGTYDHLRRDVIMDLVKDATEKDEQVVFVLPENPFPTPMFKNVVVAPPIWDIESYVKKCTTTAGIFIGRTTIEGFLCNKPGLVYDVDVNGRILQKATYTVPKNLDQFSISYMTDALLKLV